MNISNPGPVESWQEVLAQHARDQLTSATAVKARGGLPCNSPPGPSSSSKACVGHGLHSQSLLSSICQ